jgi:hypothetical protein
MAFLDAAKKDKKFEIAYPHQTLIMKKTDEGEEKEKGQSLA